MDVPGMSPRSPKPSLQQRYKKKSLTPWKETYRKRCLDRLKTNRSNLVSKFRSLSASGMDSNPLVEELMAVEWQTMCTELSTSTHANFDSFKNENIDEVISIFEEVKAELVKEEQEIVADFEANQQFDAAALESVISQQEAAPHFNFLSTHQGAAQVCCPICCRNPLMLNKGVIFCTCGTRIDTEQDCISLEFVEKNLSEGLQMHSDSCQEKEPQFSVVKQLGIDNLLMTCSTCDFWFVVI